jgi:4-hydroxy-3-methylbut-2-en-1-yl diphosphate synthase IspG/GcpE
MNDSIEKIAAEIEDFCRGFDGGRTIRSTRVNDWAARLRAIAAESHDWQCGCGHWCGPNLTSCPMCGRRPYDMKYEQKEAQHG